MMTPSSSSGVVKRMYHQSSERVHMWGSDWPVTEQKPNLEQVEQLGLKDQVKQMFLRYNAVRVFKLKV